MAIRFGSLVVVAALGGSSCTRATAAPATETITIGGGTLEVSFGSGHLALSRAELMTWISHSAEAVTAYFTRFPVARFRIRIEPVADRTGVLGGTTWAYGGAHTRVNVGEHTTVTDLSRDWVMTHEMIHTAFPDQPEAQLWIQEGISTYVEPLARAWVGRYPPEKIWTDLVSDLPKGLPARGDRGLDHTHTWGRTYWGGALFCFLADLEIRTRTGGARGLVDALRGILAAGGNNQVAWSIERAFREGDKAVGVPVLQELYARMKDAPVAPDLPAIWRSLGVELRNGTLAVDDTAPKAALRRAIGTRPATPALPTR